MPRDNVDHLRTNVEKATFALADLYDSDGGALAPKEAKAFVHGAILKPKILQTMDVVPMDRKTEKVNKIWVDDDVLVPGVSGQAVPEAWRPNFSRSEREWTAKLYKVHIRVDDDVFEDNIQKESLRRDLLDIAMKKVGQTWEKLIILGDTTSANPLLATMDGILKDATLHLVDGGNNTLDDDILDDVDDEFPEEYEGDADNMVFWTHKKAVKALTRSRRHRQTAGGDAYLEGAKEPRSNFSPVIKVPLWPTNYGAASTTAVLYTEPKNSKVGVLKKLKLIPVQDQIAGSVNFVGHTWFTRAWRDPEAVVKLYDVAV